MKLKSKRIQIPRVIRLDPHETLAQLMKRLVSEIIFDCVIFLDVEKGKLVLELYDDETFATYEFEYAIETFLEVEYDPKKFIKAAKAFEDAAKQCREAAVLAAEVLAAEEAEDKREVEAAI